MPAVKYIAIGLIGVVVAQALVWVVLMIVALSRDTGWSGLHEETGPIPLSSDDKPIKRLVNTRKTFENDYRDLRWDEGNGPVDADDRIKLLMESIPKELTNRLRQTINLPSKLPGDKGMADYALYESWGTIVSLNPDVLIVTVFELPKGEKGHLPVKWFRISKERSDFLRSRTDFVTYRYLNSRLYAGTLMPWSKEMHVFSTDSEVKTGLLTFESDRADIILPMGKLELVRNGDDVDVKRK